jgi:hypothetical protein
MKYLNNNEKGIALIIALMLMIMLAIIGLGIVSSANDEVAIAGNELNEMKAFYAAEAGLDKATAWLQAYYDATGIPPVTSPAETLNVNGITFGYSTVPGTPTNKVLTKDLYVGLRANVDPYFVRSTGVDSSHSTAFTLEQTFQVAHIPLFQYSAFYQGDLEISANNPMTLSRVHANGNVYLQSSSNLQFDSYVTASGSILHGPKAGSGLSAATGDVRISNVGGTMISMKDGSDWLDATTGHWFDSATARWNGRVQDFEFGAEPLVYPLPSATDSSHMMIQRASAGGGNPVSLENKATFKIIDGQAYAQVGGIWTNATAYLTALGVISETSFYDKREGQDVSVVDIDMSALNASGYLPTSGVVYISDNRYGFRATRLNQAEDISLPLTVVCENPVYTVGSVNTVTKVPFAIIADALTILSDNWDDLPAKATSSTVSDRPAINTTLNLAFAVGHTETKSGIGYGGGLENLPRLLEDWSGRTLTFRGSMVSLWTSQQTIGAFSTSYFNAPIRDWAFDPDLADPLLMPPVTPSVRAYIRFGWRQSDVGFAVEDFNPTTTDVIR